LYVLLFAVKVAFLDCHYMLVSVRNFHISPRRGCWKGWRSISFIGITIIHAWLEEYILVVCQPPCM